MEYSSIFSRSCLIHFILQLRVITSVDGQVYSRTHLLQYSCFIREKNVNTLKIISALWQPVVPSVQCPPLDSTNTEKPEIKKMNYIYSNHLSVRWLLKLRNMLQMVGTLYRDTLEGPFEGMSPWHQVCVSVSMEKLGPLSMLFITCLGPLSFRAHYFLHAVLSLNWTWESGSNVRNSVFNHPQSTLQAN